MKITRSKRTSPQVSKAAIIKSVASSTAIETGQPIAELEAKLKAGDSKFKHITLSRDQPAS